MWFFPDLENRPRSQLTKTCTAGQRPSLCRRSAILQGVISCEGTNSQFHFPDTVLTLKWDQGHQNLWKCLVWHEVWKVTLQWSLWKCLVWHEVWKVTLQWSLWKCLVWHEVSKVTLQWSLWKCLVWHEVWKVTLQWSLWKCLVWHEVSKVTLQWSLWKCLVWHEVSKVALQWSLWKCLVWHEVSKVTLQWSLWKCLVWHEVSKVSMTWSLKHTTMKPMEVFSMTWSLKGHTTIKPMRKGLHKRPKILYPWNFTERQSLKLALAPVGVQNSYWVLKIHHITNLPRTYNSFKFQHPYDQVSLKLGQRHWNITCNILLSKIKAHERFKRMLTLMTQHKTCANVQGSPFFKQKAHSTNKR